MTWMLLLLLPLAIVLLACLRASLPLWTAALAAWLAAVSLHAGWSMTANVVAALLAGLPALVLNVPALRRALLSRPLPVYQPASLRDASAQAELAELEPDLMVVAKLICVFTSFLQ